MDVSKHAAVVVAVMTDGVAPAIRAQIPASYSLRQPVPDSPSEGWSGGPGGVTR